MGTADVEGAQTLEQRAKLRALHVHLAQTLAERAIVHEQLTLPPVGRSVELERTLERLRERERLGASASGAIDIYVSAARSARRRRRQ